MGDGSEAVSERVHWLEEAVDVFLGGGDVHHGLDIVVLQFEIVGKGGVDGFTVDEEEGVVADVGVGGAEVADDHVVEVVKDGRRGRSCTWY